MILSMFFWGASWISAKLIAGVPASVAAFWRFTFMLASFLPILLLAKETWKFDKKGMLWIVLSAVALTVYNLMFFWGLHAGYAGKHGVLTTTMNPLFTFFWAALFRMRHGGWLAWLGLGVGFTGGLVQLLGDQFSLVSLTDPTGLIFVASAAVYALLTVFSQKAQKTYSLFQYSFYLYLFSSLFILPIAWGDGALDIFRWNASFWINILFIALLVGTFATTMYFFATKKIGAAKASSFTFMIPVTAVILSLFFLGEVPQITSIIGGALSLIAVVMIQWVHRRGNIIK